MSGVNKRPKFFSKEESDFFEKTPKHVLFRILRDLAIQQVSDDGYIDTWQDDPNKWITEAKNRIEIAI